MRNGHPAQGNAQEALRKIYTSDYPQNAKKSSLLLSWSFSLSFDKLSPTLSPTRRDLTKTFYEKIVDFVRLVRGGDKFG